MACSPNGAAESWRLCGSSFASGLRLSHQLYPRRCRGLFYYAPAGLKANDSITWGRLSSLPAAWSVEARRSHAPTGLAAWLDTYIAWTWTRHANSCADWKVCSTLQADDDPRCYYGGVSFKDHPPEGWIIFAQFGDDRRGRGQLDFRHFSLFQAVGVCSDHFERR